MVLISTNQTIRRRLKIEKQEHEEQWKTIKFLADKKLRLKIRRDAKKAGMNVSDYLRKLTEEG